MGKIQINKLDYSFLSVGKEDLKVILIWLQYFIDSQEIKNRGTMERNFQLKAILKKVKSLGKMSITTSINGVKMVVFSEYG